MARALLALLKKQWLVKKRNKWRTLFEIGFPVYFAAILVVVTLSSGTSLTKQEIPAPSSALLPLARFCTSSFWVSCDLAWVRSASMQSFGEHLTQQLSGVHAANITAFDSLDALLDAHSCTPFTTALWTAQSAQQSTPELVLAVTEDSADVASQDPVPVLTLEWQRFHLGQRNVSLDVSWQRFAVPVAPMSLPTTVYLWTAYFPFLFMFVGSTVVIGTVTEKQKKLKQGLRMVGVTEGQWIMSWIVPQALTAMVGTALAVVVLVAAGVVKHNVALFVVTLIVFAFSIISLGFLVSLAVERPRAGAALTVLVVFLGTGLGFLVEFVVAPADGLAWVTVLLNLICLVPLSTLMGAMGAAENVGQTLALDFGWEQSSFSSGVAFIMIFVDTVLYALLAWYFGKVLPGEYGVSPGPLFFLRRSYWKGNVAVEHQPLLMQAAPKAALEINGLEKVYRTGSCGGGGQKDVVALDGLTLRFDENQIVALLGPNGSGKSTTISILTGLFEPTAGDAFVRGRSVRRDLDLIQKDLGVCPQSDTLWDELTVYQHLELWMMLKSVPSMEIPERIRVALEEVEFEAADMHRVAKELSGGMKRKLSIAMAFVGEPSVVFLDEPTAGMDPYARERVLTMLSKKKANRLIVLTTHSMDEADLLADSIAILKRGKLHSQGTSQQLKKQFDLGYTLTLDATPEARVQDITAFFQQFSSSIVLDSKGASELMYQLPFEQLTPELLEALDENAAQLGVKEYSLHMGSLESVFLRIADDEIPAADDPPLASSAEEDF